jgi:hypothetical protein
MMILAFGFMLILAHFAHGRQGLLFIGFARNPTNQMALEWFFTHVAPLISAQLHGVSIKLVGEWQTLQHYGVDYAMPVEVVGTSQCFVPFGLLFCDVLCLMKLHAVYTAYASPADMRLIAQTSKVLISPVVASTGITTKNLFGLSSGIPVVTTSLGAAVRRPGVFLAVLMEVAVAQ